ncbi:uncharacterized protein K452DRAFT_43311 [Aplosporella prunicola CBS 121167]|uniref:Uncharacterized protein n=1 Tax=Aplosporella prunicola CBS 121167 TaxID=1176127 RepID=A0A6A6BAC3_9PEZI|nr:uncharacterized protein K452DRAFT_43311 [Aplosporella prunicola CBS 121167]KAF2140966.1 hypothetical protein K452DRAFT_43311 [Aplosporella prunicola CBS 121167]
MSLPLGHEVSPLDTQLEQVTHLTAGCVLLCNPPEQQKTCGRQGKKDNDKMHNSPDSMPWPFDVANWCRSWPSVLLPQRCAKAVEGGGRQHCPGFSRLFIPRCASVYGKDTEEVIPLVPNRRALVCLVGCYSTLHFDSGVLSTSNGLDALSIFAVEDDDWRQMARKRRDKKIQENSEGKKEERKRKTTEDKI